MARVVNPGCNDRISGEKQTATIRKGQSRRQCSRNFLPTRKWFPHTYGGRKANDLPTPIATTLVVSCSRRRSHAMAQNKARDRRSAAVRRERSVGGATSNHRIKRRTITA